MLRYATHVAKQSLYNTPPSFSIYMVRNILRWVKANGGLSGMEARNRAKAGVLYGRVRRAFGFLPLPGWSPRAGRS
jgi:phosphoserine aminotransferase